MSQIIEAGSYLMMDGHDCAWQNWIPGVLPRLQGDEEKLTPSMVDLARSSRNVNKTAQVFYLIPKFPGQSYLDLCRTLSEPLSLTGEDINNIAQIGTQKSARTIHYYKVPLLGGVRTMSDIARNRTEFMDIFFPYYIPPSEREGAKELKNELGVEMGLCSNVPAELASLTVRFNQQGGLWDSLSDRFAMALRKNRESTPTVLNKLSFAWLINTIREYENRKFGANRNFYIYENSRASSTLILRDIPDVIVLTPLSKGEWFEQPYPYLPENIGSNPLGPDRIIFKQTLNTASRLADKRGKTYHVSPGIPRAIAAQAAGTLKSFFYHVSKTPDAVK